MLMTGEWYEHPFGQFPIYPLCPDNKYTDVSLGEAEMDGGSRELTGRFLFDHRMVYEKTSKCAD